MARSKELVPHVGRLSRSGVFARRALYKGQKKTEKPAAAEEPATKEVTVGGEKNGSTRIVPTKKAPRFYPAEDVRQPKKSRKAPKPTKLRSSITPGTILILLAGRFRGKRVVFLKQLASGLLLVTGPYKANGVPLRRVNQAYVIATATKVDLGDFQVCFFFTEIKCPRGIDLIRLRSTRKSTTPTSRSPRPRAPSPQRRSSSRRASPRRRRPSPNPNPLTKRPSTPLLSLPSRRPRTFRNTLRQAGACLRVNSLTNCLSNWFLAFSHLRG